MVANGQLNMFESDTPVPVLPLENGGAKIDHRSAVSVA